MFENSFLQNLKKHTFIDINKHLNWYLEIKDPDLRKDFKAFGYYKRSTFFIIIFACFITFAILPLEAIVFFNSYDKINRKLKGFSLLVLIDLLLLCCSSWFYYISRRNTKLLCYDSLNSLIFLLTLTTLIILRISRSLLFPCNLENHLEYEMGHSCEGRGHSFLGWDTGAYLIIPPITFISLVKETRFYLVFLSFISILITICIFLFQVNRYALASVCMWTFLGGLLTIDIHFQSVKSYFLKRKLIETVVEIENMQEHNQANEMRHMIANVAHDLKTPLSSFTSGVDLINQVVNECEDSYKHSNLTLETCYEKFLSVGQYLEDIRNTNSFMLMTINRCIDYTKASKGMKLVPRYETIDLLETLRLPLNCMRNIQNRIQICLKPIAEDICTHIITDKQWLQENILCLLSNAVKYSLGGEVTISLSLVDSLLQDFSVKITSPLKLKLVSPKKPVYSSPAKILPGAFSHGNFSFDLSLSSRKPSRDSFLFPNISSEEELNFTDVGLDKIIEETPWYLLFEIEDTGIGMSEEAMSTLFNPFKQNQRFAGGTGLGLYSLAKRVESLNGQFGVQKRKDGKQGSLFWFAIPYKPDDVISTMLKRESSYSSLKILTIPTNNQSLSISTTLPYPSTKELSPKSKLSSEHLLVLVVDDSPSILKMTSVILRKQGHTVHAAENGAVAVKMIEDQRKNPNSPYDLVLMDLQMPVMDGLEATRRIRSLENEQMTNSLIFCNPEQNLALENGQNIPRRQIIIGCSANSDAETTDEAFKAGVDSFMAKPFTMDSFNVLVKKLICISHP